MTAQARIARVQLAMGLDESLRRARAAMADKAVDDFYTFFRYFAWPVLEPATKFVDNWHIHALCEHLQAVTNDEISRLIINIPFRQLKSRIVSQSWHAWEWLRKPHLQYLTGSYAINLATRDAVDARRVIESDAYQACWGDRFRMTTDQNVKTRYENSKRGMRTITSTESGATGFGGNRIIVDDPISAADADNEIARKRSIEWWKGTVATRFNNPGEDAAVIVQQRLHENDLSGYLLQTQPEVWEHLAFPMRYEETRPVFMGGKVQEVATKDIKTCIGYTDPRTVLGELLNPARLPEATVKQMELDLGEYHVGAQLQQRPTSRGGVIFKRADWQFYVELPAILDETIISVDCTFKDTKTSDYVAIQAWGRVGARYYLLKRLREKMGFGATVTAIRTYKALFPKATAVLVEDKANGSAVIETLKGDIPGIIAIEPEGGKVARAFAIQPTHESGNLYIPDPSIDPDIETYLAELSSFPTAPNDDEADATTQAVNWYKNRTSSTGILDFYQQQLDAQNQQRAA